MANERLKPFRDYDEHDVVNLFAFNDAAVPLTSTTVVYAGSLVKVRTGWSNTDETKVHGDAGATYNNVVSQRYGVTAEVEYCNGGSETPLGITLYDVRENDENGEQLKFNPQKAAELQVSISGQAVPIATKGVFLVGANAWVGGAAVVSAGLTAGAAVYVSGDGQFTPTKAENTKVGKLLGGGDADDNVLIKLEL